MIFDTRRRKRPSGDIRRLLDAEAKAADRYIERRLAAADG
jgi:hypothetical protein